MTGMPTYYYLHRYWARRGAEQSRRCPNCGRNWQNSKYSSDSELFHNFPFRCERCRLVSSQAVTFEDERHARIGEHSKRK